MRSKAEKRREEVMIWFEVIISVLAIVGLEAIMILSLCIINNVTIGSIIIMLMIGAPALIMWMFDKMKEMIIELEI